MASETSVAKKHSPRDWGSVPSAAARQLMSHPVRPLRLPLHPLFQWSTAWQQQTPVLWALLQAGAHGEAGRQLLTQPSSLGVLLLLHRAEPSWLWLPCKHSTANNHITHAVCSSWAL